MNSFNKLINHIKKGSLLSRIRDHRQIENEKRWRSFIADEKRAYIVKKFNSGGKIKLDKNNLLSRAIYNEFFEEYELNYVKKFLKKGDIFIDVGANIGLFSVIASNKVGKKGKVFSFEPSINTFNQLNENITLNELNNVKTFNFAVSSNNGELFLNLNDDDSSALNSVSKKPTSDSVEKVKCIELDSFTNRYLKNQKIALIKIDVEGWEVPVLQGMQKCMAEHKPNLIIELNEKNFKSAGFEIETLISILIENKYKLFEFDQNGHLTPFKRRAYYSYMNIVAEHD